MAKRELPALRLSTRGKVVGEAHYMAKLTDREVALMLELHEAHGIGYKRLGQKFSCSWRTVAAICSGRRRSQLPVRAKKRKPHARPLIAACTTPPRHSSRPAFQAESWIDFVEISVRNRDSET